MSLTYHIVGVGEHSLGEDILLLLRLLVAVALGVLVVLGVLVAPLGLPPVPVRVIIGTQVLVRLTVRQQTERKIDLISASPSRIKTSGIFGELRDMKPFWIIL